MTILEKHPSLTADPVHALKDSIVKSNTSLMATSIKYMTSGCTCVAVYMQGNTFYVANVGDSRCVAGIEHGGVVVAKDFTQDHKPDDPNEMARIIEWGGFVSTAPEPGLSARVWLDARHTMIGLAMSRSIGDFAVKSVGVIPEPDVTILQCDAATKFIILASDGVWEFIDSQAAVDIVSKHIAKGANAACKALIEAATSRWREEEGDYRDDVSVYLLCPAPPSFLLLLFVRTVDHRHRRAVSFEVPELAHVAAHGKQAEKVNKQRTESLL